MCVCTFERVGLYMLIINLAKNNAYSPKLESKK